MNIDFFEKPNCNTYWVIPGHLLAGEYPGAPHHNQAQEKLARFMACGIDAFLDLTSEDELAPYAPILAELAEKQRIKAIHRRLTIPDMGVPDTPGLMLEILSTIEDWLASDRRVYVHCWGGIGRTGTVIGCHLAHRGLTGHQALKRMAALWQNMSEEKRRRYPRSPQTEEQERYVINWVSTSPTR